MAQRDEFLRLLLQGEADLKAFIASVVRDPHARQDVFQDVALTLWREADRYDPGRPFGAWARGIAMNMILQRRARDSRFPATFAPETMQAVADAFDRTEEESPHWLEALRKCLRLLQETPRLLLEMRYGQGQAIGDIAAQTRRTPDAVYQALSRIRGALERCIRRHLAAEDRNA